MGCLLLFMPLNDNKECPYYHIMLILVYFGLEKPCFLLSFTTVNDNNGVPYYHFVV